MSMPGNQQQQQQASSLLTTVAQNIVTALNGIAQVFKNAFPSIRGTFTMPAASTLAIAQPAIQSNSVVSLVAMNAAAATLQGSAKALYVTITAGTGFSVTTGSGGNAAGTEIFSYTVF